MSSHQDGTVKQTDKNRAFVRSCVLDFDKHKSLADHYFAVFGGKAQRSSMHCMASRLLSAPSMVAYANQVREELRERFMVTVDSLLDELEEARQVGLKTESAGPMVAATMGKAKLAGLDKQIIDHRSTDGSMRPTTIMLAGPENVSTDS